MSRSTYVGGTYTKITCRDHNIYATQGNIVNNAATIVKQVGEEGGVCYGQPKEPKLSKKTNFLYLLFYIDEDHKGKLMISEAAQTRLKNIKRKPWYDDDVHQAYCIPLQSVDEIIEQVKLILEKHSTDDIEAFVKEVGYFSHAGLDGPIAYNQEVKTYPAESTWPHQMALEGWGQIKFKWSVGARCVFYGCNTGRLGENMKNFAESISNLSNFKEVSVWGQSTSSFPSFYPDFRVTSVARSVGKNGMGWNIRENTYQVGGNDGEGSKALSYSPTKNTLDKEDLKEEDYPPANPLNAYLNGSKILSSHQGIFNNHI